MVKMNKRLIFFAAIAGILLGVVGVFFLLGVLRNQTAGISIETNVGSRVFIDGREVGRTPYNGTLTAHTTLVRLVPYDTNLVDYETKVDLTPGVKTIIRRNFSSTEAGSSGQIISFEKTTDEPTVAIVTLPDGAFVGLDGRGRGFSPIKVSKISSGVHQLNLSLAGYSDAKFSIKTVDGYKLTAVVKLSQATDTLAAQTQAAPEVEILRSPSGFLKAREAPNATSNEIGQVNTGERYKFLNKSSDLNWYEIDLGGGKSGWISGQYATVSGMLK